ncbi:MAG: RNA methyltransferase [Clostridia bacterium]|nr:RNA methyltransferase [Clostridia bacterium]
MQVITSKDNELIKEIKKLKEKKYRDTFNKYIVEGIKLVGEAIQENADIDCVVVCEDCMQENIFDKKLMYEIAKLNCIYVTGKVFATITDVSNPQGILAVIKRPDQTSKINYDEDIIVVLDGIQDPGNLGTILRTVDSANLKQLVVSNETADCFNSKVVRSTMGAIFRVNVIKSENLLDDLIKMKNNGFSVVVTSLDTEDSVYDIKYNKKVIVIGNEANGVSKAIQDAADNKVKIPMLGKTESLNASVAAGIMIYEYVRGKIGKKEE